MVNTFRYMNLTVVLPDGRILLQRNMGAQALASTQWSGSVERFLATSMDPGIEAARVLYSQFKVRPSLQDSGSVVIDRLAPIESLSGRYIVPFVVRIKTHLNFQALTTEQFQAGRFDDILDDILANSIYPKQGQFPRHTPTFIHVARALHERREFGI